MRVFSTGVFVIISISSCVAWWEEDDESFKETRTRLKHDMIFMRAVADYVKEDILNIYTIISLQEHLERRLDLCLTPFGEDNTTNTPESGTTKSITDASSTSVIETSKTKDVYEVSESIEHTTSGGKRKTTRFWPSRGIEPSTFESDDEYFISDEVKKDLRVPPLTPNSYAPKTIPRALEQNVSNEANEDL